MKNTLRKVAAVVSAVAMSLGMLVATAAPASAVTIDRLPWPTLAQYEVGDTVDFDFSCKPTFDGEVVGPSSSALQFDAPPGTTLDPDYHLRGTFTTTGTFDLGAIRCYTGSDTPSNWYNFYIGSLIVVPATTDAPTLKALAAFDANCSVRLFGVMPTTPDAGTPKLMVDNGTHLYNITLRNYAAAEVVDLLIPMNSVGSWASSSSDVAATDNTADSELCGTDVTFVLAYQHAGAPAATSTAVVHPRAVQTEPTLFASTVLDQACTIRITGTVTRHSDDDMIKVSSRTFDRGVDIMLKGIKPDVPIDVTLKLDDVDALTNNPKVHSVYSWGDPVECQNLGLDAIVYYNGGGYGVTVKSTAWLRGECPAGQYGKVIATDSLVYRECVNAQPGYYVPTANVLAEPIACDDGSYSDLSGATGCKDAEPGHFVAGFGEAFQTECPAGTFASDYNQNRCVPAPIGYYVDQMGATEATQCPAGFTTMTEGSMNSWNCFRDDDTMCLPGSYSATGYEPCTVATPGFYVPFDGARNQMPCDLGTYSDTAGASSCTKAAKGYYVNKTGASSATKCSAGLTTELSGSRSKNECYKQKFQTAKAINTPTKLKFGGKFETAGRADAGLSLNAVATGSCTLTATTKTVKINGKSVKQPRWVIKATKKAGNCKVTFSNDGDYTYKPFTVTKTIKVTKTGK